MIGTKQIIALTSLFMASQVFAITGNGESPDCGVAGNAKYDDCRYLIDNWPAQGNYANTCHYINAPDGEISATAYNPACYGTCCVYVTTQEATWTSQDGANANVKDTVTSIVEGCNANKKSVNGVWHFDDIGTTTRVSVTNRDGCGDSLDGGF